MGIFNKFATTDIVAGRTTRIASGFWPNATTFWSASLLEDGFFDLTQSAATPSPSYGSSIYDVRHTAYYIDVYPNTQYHVNNDPYLSVAYGNFFGDFGSGSFDLDTGSILSFPPKAIYTQYKNLLLGTSNVEEEFSFASGSAGATVVGDDIFVIDFSSHKMKDSIDAGLLEISLTGSNGLFTFRDDSPFLTQASSVYNMVTGSINSQTSTLPAYQGIGLFYPNNGVVIFNAQAINNIVGLSNVSGSSGNVSVCIANYSTASNSGVAIQGQLIQTTVNHKVFFWSLQNSNQLFKARKSELVPSRHYFVRVKNQDFNYSNNPTYVFDGSDGIHAAGTIFNQDFISDPRTYVTSVGLYNDNNELVAIAKLSRPALKDFSSELLIKVRLDF